jgi:hypothetical protein
MRLNQKLDGILSTPFMITMSADHSKSELAVLKIFKDLIGQKDQGMMPAVYLVKELILA